VGYKAQTLKRLIEIIISLLILIRQRAKLGGTLLESRGYIDGKKKKVGGTLLESRGYIDGKNFAALGKRQGGSKQIPFI